MNFEIKSYIGAGNVLLEMTSEQIQDVMEILPTKFKKITNDEIYTDAYEGFHVYYKNDGKCEAIEFFEPSTPLLNGQHLINKPFIEVKNYFYTIDDSRVNLFYSYFTSQW